MLRYGPDPGPGARRLTVRALSHLQRRMFAPGVTAERLEMGGELITVTMAAHDAYVDAPNSVEARDRLAHCLDTVGVYCTVVDGMLLNT